MKTDGFRYRVELCVAFTQEEAEALCALAKLHYDSTCKAAGMSRDDGARETGFLAQLLLTPDRLAARWAFHQFDVTAKILEQLSWALAAHKGKFEVLQGMTAKMIHAMCAINDEYDRLTKEAECKTTK